MENLHNKADLESLEDRIRRMALTNQANRDNAISVSRPIVRLPFVEADNGMPGNAMRHPTSPDQPGVTPMSPSRRYYRSAETPLRGQAHGPSATRYTDIAPAPVTYASANTPQHGAPTNHYSNLRNRQSFPRGGGGQHPQQRQQVQLDPGTYRREPAPQYGLHGAHSTRTLFHPNMQHADNQPRWEDLHNRQVQYLDDIATREIPPVEMTQSERTEKDNFRQTLQQICHEVCNAAPNRLPIVSLECFGSFQSGFANAGSDMDLVIVVQGQTSNSASFSLLEDDLPRALEKALLQYGLGARLLTRTRVPIIKVCQSPPSNFLDKLRQERESWDLLPNEKKYPHLYPEDDEVDESVLPAKEPRSDHTGTIMTQPSNNSPGMTADRNSATGATTVPAQTDHSDTPAAPRLSPETDATKRQQARNKRWTRERTAGPLDFPKSDVGIQTDINFFNPLGLHNTQMLRCYSICDPRVRPMVLFVKCWVKRRKINSSYSGTLSSYGYVLMVLHYLVNIARPPVLPNLQHPWRPDASYTPQSASLAEVDGWVVDFWRNEDEIRRAAQAGQLTANRESLGSLLAGFFQYYSSLGRGLQFRWTQQVLSLRTPRGIMSKDEKGWVKATTEEGEGKRIQHRYLFCIEDPFELSHNVARTVTHNGIVAIRDEFRRAFNILQAVGHGAPSRDGDLFAQHVDQSEPDGTAPPASPASRRKSLSGNQAPRSAQASKSMNVHDTAAFPALASPAAKPSPALKQAHKSSPKQSSSSKPAARAGEISGQRAKAFLDELKKRKAEAQAESAAAGMTKTALE